MVSEAILDHWTMVSMKFSKIYSIQACFLSTYFPINPAFQETFVYAQIQGGGGAKEPKEGSPPECSPANKQSKCTYFICTVREIM